MTNEEAIQSILDHIKVHKIGKYPHIRIAEAINMALAALRAQAEAEKNETGTLEKLRKMDGERITRFDRIRNCETPEEMAVELNADGRRFCPKEYTKKDTACTAPCGECIVIWLREETGS